MADKFDRAVRSRIMRAIRAKDTMPEVIIRRFLWRRGFRYRKNVRGLPGTPDVVLRRYKTALFVHGCFWHQHRGCRNVKKVDQNAEKWIPKLAANVARDERAIAELKQLGWKVIVIWECGVRASRNLDNALAWLPARIRTRNVMTLTEWPERS